MVREVFMGQTTCSSCGSPVNPGDLFCLNCGAMLDPKLGGGASSSWSIPKKTSATKAAGPVASVVTPTPAASTPAEATSTVRTVGATPTTRAASTPVTVTTKAARSYAEDTESISDTYRSVAPIPIPMDEVGDDSYTIVVDDDDPDAPTFVFVEEPVLTLTRMRNGETVQLELPAMVGKGTKATARISGNRGISRQHALITQEGETYLLEDNNSTNGTFVGETRLQPNVAVPLEDGMVFRLADEDFEFHID